MADILHSRQDHVVQAVSSIRALRHDERLERHPARAVWLVVKPEVGGDQRHHGDHAENEQARDAKDDPLVPFARRRPRPGAHIRALGFVDILLELGKGGLWSGFVGRILRFEQRLLLDLI